MGQGSTTALLQLAASVATGSSAGLPGTEHHPGPGGRRGRGGDRPPRRWRPRSAMTSTQRCWRNQMADRRAR